MRSKDMVGTLDQQTSEIGVAGVRDAELRIMISGLTPTLVNSSRRNVEKFYQCDRCNLDLL